MRLSAIVFSLLLVLGVLILVGWLGRRASEASTKAFPKDRIQGVTFDSWREPTSDALVAMQNYGIKHMSLTTFGWQKAYNVPFIQMSTDPEWYTESDRGIRALAKAGAENDIQVIIKPHIWLSNSAAEEFYAGKKKVVKKWRNAIEFEDEEDWLQWEDEYRTFMMHYAHLAEDVGAELLCIGTELTSTVRERPQFLARFNSGDSDGLFRETNLCSQLV